MNLVCLKRVRSGGCALADGTFLTGRGMAYSLRFCFLRVVAGAKAPDQLTTQELNVPLE